MALKKLNARQKAQDKATSDMSVLNGSCGDDDSECGNTPTLLIGRRRICAECALRMKTDHPNSYRAFWEPKLVPIN